MFFPDQIQSAAETSNRKTIAKLSMIIFQALGLESRLTSVIDTHLDLHSMDSVERLIRKLTDMRKQHLQCSGCCQVSRCVDDTLAALKGDNVVLNSQEYCELSTLTRTVGLNCRGEERDREIPATLSRRRSSKQRFSNNDSDKGTGMPRLDDSQETSSKEKRDGDIPEDEPWSLSCNPIVDASSGASALIRIEMVGFLCGEEDNGLDVLNTLMEGVRGITEKHDNVPFKVNLLNKWSVTQAKRVCVELTGLSLLFQGGLNPLINARDELIDLIQKKIAPKLTKLAVAVPDLKIFGLEYVKEEKKEWSLREHRSYVTQFKDLQAHTTSYSTHIPPVIPRYSMVSTEPWIINDGFD